MPMSVISVPSRSCGPHLAPARHPHPTRLPAALARAPTASARVPCPPLLLSSSRQEAATPCCSRLWLRRSRHGFRAPVSVSASPTTSILFRVDLTDTGKSGRLSAAPSPRPRRAGRCSSLCGKSRVGPRHAGSCSSGCR